MTYQNSKILNSKFQCPKTQALKFGKLEFRICLGFSAIGGSASG
jgi:hypothetical protein